MLISAHNEADVIGDKIENSLLLDYPKDHLEIWFGLDAPTDSTPEILKQQKSDDGIHIVEFTSRRGKLAVLADLAQQTTAEILLLTDANTMLDRNCVQKMVRHFVDSDTAAVSAEEIRTATREVDSGGEGIYWRYESALKILESRLNCLQGGNGAALAIRRSLFKPKAGSIVEDFQIPLELRFQGHRVVYDPEAIAIEEITPTFSAQFKRRVRIGAGNYQTLFGNPRYLNPVHGLLTFAFISHRVFRWLTPLCLVLALACSIAMVAEPVFASFLGAQLAFYSAALIGYVLKKRAGRISSLLSMPLHFCSMNLALLLGFYTYVTGRQAATWNPTPRRRASRDNLAQVESTTRIGRAA